MKWSRTRAEKWVANKFDEEFFEEGLQQNTALEGIAENKALQIGEKLRRACDASMPRYVVS